jgi:hypothetical protein
VQGPDEKRSRTQTASFAVGFAASAVATFGLLWWVGRDLDLGESEAAVAASLVLLVALVAADARANRANAWTSLGPKRQTPKLLKEVLPPQLVGLAWGLDAGVPFTTFRVTTATWAIVVLSLLGEGSPLVGPAYAAAFLGPLLWALWPGHATFKADPNERIYARSLDGRIFRVRGLSMALSSGVAVLGAVAWL